MLGHVSQPHPGPGEVRIRISVSGINPGDLKKRENAFGYGMPYPRVVPHSDFLSSMFAWIGGIPLLYLCFCFRLATAASERFAADRKAGALELILGAAA